MKTTESMMLRDLKRYLHAGYGLESAIFQVKSLHLHRHDPAIDRAAKELKPCLHNSK